MSTFSDSIYKLNTIDDLGKQDSIIHSMNSVVKLIVTLVYILFVVSFPKYNISGLIPFIIYPIMIIYLADIPVKLVLKASLIGLPIVIGLGVFNLIFERTVTFYIGFIPVTWGFISLISLFIKAMLTISAGILLICTTGIEGFAKSLRDIKVPKIFTNQIVFMYRYIFVLIRSVGEVYNAYMMRAPNQKGINIKVWGPLLGHLLLRSFERADRIYNAMILRGFDGEYVTFTNEKPGSSDYIYMLVWILFFVVARFVNIPLFIGGLVTGTF